MIVNVHNWQDPGGPYITEMKAPNFVEAFRMSYKPVASGNKLWIQINGTGASGIGNVGVGKRNWQIYMAASFTNAKSWLPPSYPGDDYPSVLGPFMATTAHCCWQNPEPICSERREVYLLTGELTVPDPAPAEIFLRIMFNTAAGNCPDARIHGGSIVHIMEYTPRVDQ